MDSSSDDESYIIEAERKAKQNYLTEEVLDCNYDPDLFMMFCAEKKEANIDAWSFDELQECVHEFKMTYRRGQTLADVKEAREKEAQEQGGKKKSLSGTVKNSENAEKEKTADEANKSGLNSVKPSEENQSKPEKSNLVQPVDYPVDKTPLNPSLRQKTIDQNSFFKATSVKEPKASDKLLIKSKTVSAEKPKGESDLKQENEHSDIKKPVIEETKETVIIDQKFTIKCLSSEETDLSKAENLKFLILASEEVQGGFFSSNYHLYPVKVSPLGWECKRRFSEFV